MVKPKMKDGKLIFTITWWKKKGDPGDATKGYITGRFTEILLVHFKNYFTQLQTHA